MPKSAQTVAVATPCWPAPVSAMMRLRAHTKLPIAVGFGVSTPKQFSEVGSFADAAVVGSAIVQCIEQNRGREAAAVSEFLTSLTANVGPARASG